MRLNIHESAIAVIIAGLLAGCSDQITAPRGQADPSFAIVDGARGGDARFFFLPPMVPAPSYSGTFNASRSPVVQRIVASLGDLLFRAPLRECPVVLRARVVDAHRAEDGVARKPSRDQVEGASRLIEPPPTSCVD